MKQEPEILKCFTAFCCGEIPPKLRNQMVLLGVVRKATPVSSTSLTCRKNLRLRILFL